MKVVIDTNALIDASEDFYHYANRILDLVIAGRIEAYANKATLRENKFLADKKILDEGFQKKLEYFFELVRPIENSVHLNIVEDREDNKILESAVASEADFLVTSDKHLLKVEKFKGVKIVTPARFWSIWEDEGEGWTKWLRNFIH
ncbi:MAG: putative toxin-antitoxin system toxin component, PIN family [Candidatus Doudnabacteria bacterium RIFCSPLOWO2_02_FULL_42_9]|uniref:Putative toxin-antitoxin system toxin component, PIN family n=1 Tax=Candidatus Doudnabacteria bacterium RIFCSPHIGHO2_01_FULL_41_86 TaxID=1817821 RepID=A0A1F5N846_9BACT|nr:MAG: putative toxin-antitoxin system toxin component, PIN family [Candidatus Doudnabacteria bacterium RIFCSPHIGHO2_01_FULL_41_86]OGE74923.1 MAG: putative toxin-antitoxin system toxin component, PIN family [Candidatus Doudnabacteria bacterium RIFCSPHIGHO2_01_43_10]OGE85791.1 MAG: putative toxin-antitoxin system toxin component, PIN family [Candidatus Doudnabacteria bacterium RIFCSPHIGHO2_12_FULL_42_22]OGE87286.1 MAG: putative toxin-antitoxin system toxin component, PIN family [Candidatus Doudn